MGLAYVLDNTRYFALLSRKWQYLILERQETGTEHVAIATSKWVPSGIFVGCNIPANFQWHCFIIGGDINRPLPSSPVPLFQGESKCETFHMKMSSACSLRSFH